MDAYKFKILIIHNKYQQYGGEDSVVAEEEKMLRQYGHVTQLYTKDNQIVDRMSKLSLLANTLWSRNTTKEVGQILEASKPDVVHIHNTFPLVSPSVYWEINKQGIPIVQTIHNFRLSCLQAMFLRKGSVCEKCLGKFPWRGIVNRCYRDSMASSTVLAMMLQLHRMIGTYGNKINAYIALNKFCKNKLIEMGIQENKIYIKPNFIESKNNDDNIENDGNPLFVGRLSKEKGIDLLADVITNMPNRQFDIVGSGPESDTLENIPNAIMHGKLSQNKVQQMMKKAPFLILPSIWYENMPMTLVEAFANGTPVISSRIGALIELIDDGNTGLHFKLGSSDDLRKKITWALINKDQMKNMGNNAKKVYLNKYTRDINYHQLIDIYKKAHGEMGKLN
jgi:glycosyltransferase involved in cell wall biosynthesis